MGEFFLLYPVDISWRQVLSICPSTNMTTTSNSLIAVRMKIRISFIDSMLGTKAADPTVFASYIATKRPEGPSTDELVSAESAEIKGTTGFHKDTAGNPFVYDYQVRGFLKESFGALKQMPKSKVYGIPTYKQKVDLFFFVYPRMIPLVIPEKQSLGVCERPLRAETMQGPRMTVVRSEEVPIGTTMEFEVASALDKVKIGDKSVLVEDAIAQTMDYGAFHGFGQWRNSGKGRFTWEFVEVVKGKELAGSSAEQQS